MVEDSDLKLTQLAAKIMRDAVRVYDPGESGLLLAGFSSALWGSRMLGGFDATTSFAITGALPALTGSSPAVTGSFPATTGSLRALLGTGSQQAATGSAGTFAAPRPTGRFKAITGSFRAITESFLAIGPEPGGPAVTLKSVFRLPDRLPGVPLPPAEELAATARTAQTMALLEALARWLGKDGCPVSETGGLASTDAADAARHLGIAPEQLSFLWRCALTSGWFELIDSDDRPRGWAVIGQTAWRWADGDDNGALHVWAAVFAAVAAKVPGVMAGSAADAASDVRFDGQGVALAVMLFLARRNGLTGGGVEDLVRNGAIGEHPSSRTRRAWDARVRQHGDPAHILLRELAGLGAVMLPHTAAETVELTPLALWALREQFTLDNISVPVLSPPSPEMSGANLVALAAVVDDDEFDAAFATWIHDRDPGLAAQELLIYAPSAEPQGRMTAAGIARRIGLPAYRSWKDAMKSPELRGYARIALTMLASELPESAGSLAADPAPGPEEMTGIATDLLAMACGADDPDPDEIAAQFGQAVPAGQEAWVIGLMARSSHPDVACVLDVLNLYHPDRRIAREAGKARRAVAKNRRRAGRRHVPARTAGR